jgi:hypothetical protein
VQELGSKKREPVFPEVAEGTKRNIFCTS